MSETGPNRNIVVARLHSLAADLPRWGAFFRSIADMVEADGRRIEAEDAARGERERMERVAAEAGIAPLVARGDDEMGTLRAAYGAATGGGVIPEGVSIEEARAAYAAIGAGAAHTAIPWMGEPRASGGEP